MGGARQQLILFVFSSPNIYILLNRFQSLFHRLLTLDVFLPIITFQQAPTIFVKNKYAWVTFIEEKIAAEKSSSSDRKPGFLLSISGNRGHTRTHITTHAHIHTYSDTHAHTHTYNDTQIHTLQ